MKKIFNFILLFLFITILVSCNTDKPPHEHIFIDGKCECGQIDPNKPWDDLGGGGQGDDNKESDITTDDAGNNDYVENPDKDKFEINIEGATYINLSNLSFDSNDYNYADNTLAIEKEGIYVLTGTLNGSVIVKGSASKITIILYNATIETLNTQNTVALLFEKNSGERILSIYEGTINTLSDSIGDDENGDGAIIQAKKSSLTINGTGTLNLISKGFETTAIKVKNNLEIYGTNLIINTSDHGIKAGELLSIHNANITIDALGDGIKTDVEAESVEQGNELTSNPFAGYIYIENTNIKIASSDDGISANSLLKINNTNDNVINIITNGGAPNTITETSSDNADGKAIKVDGINLVTNDTETLLPSKCENNYSLYILGGTFIINSNDDAISSKGNLIIDNGFFDITSGDDGIHSEYITRINNGNIIVRKCYEAIEGAAVEIYNGNIDVTSVDDGINAANSDLINYPYNIYIGGGNIIVNAQGDGVDSNGTIEFAGGITIIYGPTNGGNGSLDADRGILVKGGILVAVGAAGMVETPSSNSTQCCVAYALNGSANSTLKVVDENNKVLFETVCPKTYQSVVISLPEFTIGNSYTISNESSSQTFTIVSILTNALGGGMGPGGMPPGDRPGGGGPRPR